MSFIQKFQVLLEHPTVSRLLELLFVAVISALITFLQELIGGDPGVLQSVPEPAEAGTLAAIVRGIMVRYL